MSLYAKRVLVVDDHPILRDGLAALIDESASFNVVGQASSGRDALDQCKLLQPHFVIMDVAMPHLNGVTATERILEATPETKVIALSMHAEPQIVREMLRAGAAGYVLKVSAFDELVDAMETVAANERYLSPRIASTVVQDYLSLLDTGPRPDSTIHLSRRERAVVQLLASGSSTKEIVYDLGVSTRTVDAHRRAIQQKMNLTSLADLIKVAIRDGLTSPEPARSGDG